MKLFVIMRNFDKRTILALILAIFTLIESCYVNNEKPTIDSPVFAKTENRNPIANYCLEIGKYGSGELKLESIIDSSVFAEMEKRNRWQTTEDKQYFAKVKDRDGIVCSSPGEVIHKKYSFLFKNMEANYCFHQWPDVNGMDDCEEGWIFFSSSSSASSSSGEFSPFDDDYDGEGYVEGGSGGIGDMISCCMDSIGRIGGCPEETPSDIIARREETLAWLEKRLPKTATTEIIIDFRNTPLIYPENDFVFNEIKSSFGDTIPVSWKFKIVCPSHSDTTITGSYFIRITGECK
jgi:hypothetical protein